MPANSLISYVALLIALLAGSWQMLIKPRLVTFGFGREIQSINNHYCQKLPELAACEKITLHQPTGLLFLACSTPSSRVHWTPAVGRLNTTGASRDDYVAVYNPKSSKITRLTVNAFESQRGLSLHGMDVVPSATNPSELFIYLVNHRAPLGNVSAQDVGADSVIEIFKTTLNADSMTHIKTIKDPVILAPNDVAGSSDGKSFYFTNDNDSKVGFKRNLALFGVRLRASSVGYCHVEQGCHYAIQDMCGNNGIARAANGTFYVANCLSGGLSVLEQQTNNTLVLKDFIPVDRPMDNLSIDAEGFVWAAGFPDLLKLITQHFANPSIHSPSAAFRFSTTNASTETFESKYKVEHLFEDDGSVASGTTSVAYDTERNLLFLSGLSSPHLTVCKL